MYGRLLATEVIALLGLRLMQQEPRLTSLVYLLISGVAVLTTTPILQMSWSSPTEARPTSRTIYFERGGLPTLLTLKWMWLSAVLTEAIWQYAIWFRPGLGTHISILHMLTWLALMLALLRRMLHALVAESVINEYVVMGAVAGYLLIGFTGGVMMNSLLTIDPGAFLLNTDNLIINGQLLPASIQQPPIYLLGIHSERHDCKKLRCWDFSCPIIGTATSHLRCPTPHGIKNFQCWHQFAATEYFNFHSPSRHFFYQLSKKVAAFAQNREIGWPGSHHFPFIRFARDEIRCANFLQGFLS